ncbi:MAG: aminoacyl-tRNA hydrolase, partial [Pseudonocardiales bacterium]
APPGGRSNPPPGGRRDHVGVRLGRGRPPGRLAPPDFVLHDFSAVQLRELDLLVERCADAVEHLLAQGLAATQNQFH